LCMNKPRRIWSDETRRIEVYNGMKSLDDRRNQGSQEEATLRRSNTQKTIAVTIYVLVSFGIGTVRQTKTTVKHANETGENPKSNEDKRTWIV
jgi:hypothetical protein